MVAVKLQIFRHDFETLQIRSNKVIQSFVSRVLSMVNQMRGSRDNIAEDVVVFKVLRSLTPRFDYIVVPLKSPKT